MELNFSQALSLLQKIEDVAVVFHKNPDGDAVCSAAALCLGLMQLGKKCAVYSFSDVPDRFKFLFTNFEFQTEFRFKNVVAVDLASSVLLEDEMKSLSIDLVIDHHRISSVNSNFSFVDKNAAATCELIFELLKGLEIEMTPQIAMFLYVGTATDTGCFKFSNTTAKTHKIASELVFCLNRFGVDVSKINFNLFDVKTKQQLELQCLAVKNLKLFFNDRCSFVAITKQMFLNCGCKESDFFVVVDVARSLKGVKMAIVVRELKMNVFKVSVRTLDDYNACEFCEKFGGGGHFKAAGFEIQGSLTEIEKQILSCAGEFFDRHSLC